MGFGLSYEALQRFFSHREPKFRAGDDGWHIAKVSISATKVAASVVTASRSATATSDYRLLFQEICPSALSLPSVFATATDVRTVIQMINILAPIWSLFPCQEHVSFAPTVGM